MTESPFDPLPPFTIDPAHPLLDTSGFTDVAAVAEHEQRVIVDYAAGEIRPADGEHEFRELVRQQIRAAFGIDDLGPEERESFEAYGRLVDAMRADEAAFVAHMQQLAADYQAGLDRVGAQILAGFEGPFTGLLGPLGIKES